DQRHGSIAGRLDRLQDLDLLDADGCQRRTPRRESDRIRQTAFVLIIDCTHCVGARLVIGGRQRH
ncbi:MAG: hypothetical protein ACK56I_24495, partial [bacterium]